MVKYIKEYIDFTMTYQKNIDKYVPNKHIAEVFAMVQNFIDKYPGYTEAASKLFTPLPQDKADAANQVYKVYQKLREKHNIIRNAMLLSMAHSIG